MRILLTGGCGFIGRHVREQLALRGHDVYVIDALVSQVHGLVRRGEEPIDLSWRTTVGNAALQRHDNIFDVDAVIHLAAEVGVGQSQYEPAKYVYANVYETALLWERIIERRASIRKVVVASSMSVYGEGSYSIPEGIVERGMVRVPSQGWDVFRLNDRTVRNPMPIRTNEYKVAEPSSVYAQSKYDTEKYSTILGAAYSIPTVALRFFNCYGNGQSLNNPYTGLLSICAGRALSGKPMVIFEDGKQTRDFIHVTDVASAVVSATERDDASGVFNVCTGIHTTVASVVDEWQSIASENGISVRDPELTRSFRSGDVRHCVGSYAAIRKELGWSPKVELKDGLRTFANWVIAAGHVANDIPDAARELKDRGLIQCANDCGK